MTDGNSQYENARDYKGLNFIADLNVNFRGH